jgi:molybdopterin-biosynthesis enzyme MoeA-like protein
MSALYDLVFTTGGVGPTHDDVTMDGVALAFGTKLQLDRSIAERIERAQGQRPNASMLKMAMLPANAITLDTGDLWFPVVVVENVHIFPGIPELLRKKFEAIRERFRGVPFVLRRVFVNQRESDIAHFLNDLLVEFPALHLGSYPKIDDALFKVLLTLESRDAEYVQRALASLLARLPPDAVHRVE